MERINNILSIQNLSSVDHSNQLHFNPHYLQIQLQIQQQMLQRQQQQQQQQQQQHHQQQQLFQQQLQHQNQLTQSQLIRHSRNLMIASNGTNGTITTNGSTGTNGTNGTNGTINQIGLQNGHIQPPRRLVDLITCKICKGYLIDAATIDLCMHSFCRPCAVKHLRRTPHCPECDVEIKDKRFLNRLKTDTTLQNIVYKLVPGLYEKEMARRRKFYSDKPSPTPRCKSEMFGDIPSSKSIKPHDMLNVELTWLNGCQDDPIRTYFHLRADSTIQVLKKLIIGKFGLDVPIKIYYGNSEVFFDLTTLKDIAAIYNWPPETKLLSLCFKEVADNHGQAQASSSLQMNSGPAPSNGPSGSLC